MSRDPQMCDHYFAGLESRKEIERKEILEHVRTQYDNLRESFRKKSPSNTMRLSAMAGKMSAAAGGVEEEEQAGGVKGGRGNESQGRNKKSISNEFSDDVPADKSGMGKEHIRCWRCIENGHYSDICTTKLCDRRDGRGHESSNFGTPVDMESVFEMVVDPGGDAVEEMNGAHGV